MCICVVVWLCGCVAAYASVAASVAVCVCVCVCVVHYVKVGGPEHGMSVAGSMWCKCAAHHPRPTINPTSLTPTFAPHSISGVRNSGVKNRVEECGCDGRRVPAGRSGSSAQEASGCHQLSRQCLRLPAQEEVS